MPTKELIVVAGPNGAGKSTLVSGLLSENQSIYLSADKIALELSIVEPMSRQYAAGVEFLQRCEAQLLTGDDFIIETTLSGKTWTGYFRRAQSCGYRIGIAFVFLDSADTCVARVRERVRRGGHDVPEEDIRRRFQRSLANFWRTYREIADHWAMLYNVGSGYVEVAFGMRDEFAVSDELLFQRFLEMAGIDQNG